MPTQSKPVLEKDIEAYFVKAVESLGGEALKLEVKGRRGWPDRLAILPGGRVVFVELKRHSGKASALQVARFRRLLALRHFCETLWSCEDVDRWAQVVEWAQAVDARL